MWSQSLRSDSYRDTPRKRLGAALRLKKKKKLEKEAKEKRATRKQEWESRKAEIENQRSLIAEHKKSRSSSVPSRPKPSSSKVLGKKTTEEGRRRALTVINGGRSSSMGPSKKRSTTRQLPPQKPAPPIVKAPKRDPEEVRAERTQMREKAMRKKWNIPKEKKSSNGGWTGWLGMDDQEENEEFTRNIQSTNSTSLLSEVNSAISDACDEDNEEEQGEEDEEEEEEEREADKENHLAASEPIQNTQPEMQKKTEVDVATVLQQETQLHDEVQLLLNTVSALEADDISFEDEEEEEEEDESMSSAAPSQNEREEEEDEEEKVNFTPHKLNESEEYMTTPVAQLNFSPNVFVTPVGDSESVFERESPVKREKERRHPVEEEEEDVEEKKEDISHQTPLPVADFSTPQGEADTVHLKTPARSIQRGNKPASPEQVEGGGDPLGEALSTSGTGTNDTNSNEETWEVDLNDSLLEMLDALKYPSLDDTLMSSMMETADLSADDEEEEDEEREREEDQESMMDLTATPVQKVSSEVPRTVERTQNRIEVEDEQESVCDISGIGYGSLMVSQLDFTASWVGDEVERGENEEEEEEEEEEKEREKEEDEERESDDFFCVTPLTQSLMNDTDIGDKESAALGMSFLRKTLEESKQNTVARLAALEEKVEAKGENNTLEEGLTTLHTHMQTLQTQVESKLETLRNETAKVAALEAERSSVEQKEELKSLKEAVAALSGQNAHLKSQLEAIRTAQVEAREGPSPGEAEVERRLVEVTKLNSQLEQEVVAVKEQTLALHALLQQREEAALRKAEEFSALERERAEREKAFQQQLQRQMEEQQRLQALASSAPSPSIDLGNMVETVKGRMEEKVRGEIEALKREQEMELRRLRSEIRQEVEMEMKEQRSQVAQKEANNEVELKQTQQNEMAAVESRVVSQLLQQLKAQEERHRAELERVTQQIHEAQREKEGQMWRRVEGLIDDVKQKQEVAASVSLSLSPSPSPSSLSSPGAASQGTTVIDAESLRAKLEAEMHAKQAKEFEEMKRELQKQQQQTIATVLEKVRSDRRQSRSRRTTSAVLKATSSIPSSSSSSSSSSLSRREEDLKRSHDSFAVFMKSRSSSKAVVPQGTDASTMAKLSKAREWLSYEKELLRRMQKKRSRARSQHVPAVVARYAVDDSVDLTLSGDEEDEKEGNESDVSMTSSCSNASSIVGPGAIMEEGSLSSSSSSSLRLHGHRRSSKSHSHRRHRHRQSSSSSSSSRRTSSSKKGSSGVTHWGAVHYFQEMLDDGF